MDFFDELDYTKCLDCETEDTTNRTILWTTENGEHEWVCPKCQAIREFEDTEREQAEKDKVDFAADMW